MASSHDHFYNSTSGRSLLLLLTIYAAFQLLLYTQVLTTPITPPVRGSPATLCSGISFSQEGLNDRVKSYDTTPYIAPPYSRAQQLPGSEKTFTELSLLREATRDQWILFAGDATLKEVYYSYASVLARDGLQPRLSDKTIAKRAANKHATGKEESRVGSTRVSFSYTPFYSTFTTQIDFLCKKEVILPSLVVISTGMFDILNRTEEDISSLEGAQEVMLDRLESCMTERLTGLKVLSQTQTQPLDAHFSHRIPQVLVLSSPRLLDSTLTSLTSSQKKVLDRNDVMERKMKERVQAMAERLETMKENQAKKTIVYVDSHGLIGSVKSSSDLIYHDTTYHSLFSPTLTSVSVASYTSCVLGQPSWSLAAFTPGQIGLFGLWMICIALWMYLQAVKRPSTSSCSSSMLSTLLNFLGISPGNRGVYQRVASTESAVENGGKEMEMGVIGSGVNGTKDALGDNEKQATNGHHVNGNGLMSENGHANGSGVAEKHSNVHAISVKGDGPITSPIASSSSHPQTLFQYLHTPSFNTILVALIQFGFILLYMFCMDGNQRLAWWIIGDKQYVRDTFFFLLIVIGIIAWRSKAKTSEATAAAAGTGAAANAGTPSSSSSSSTTALPLLAPIDNILNREQTEEWKGWMQILFVLYHFFAAKEMYNSIRIFIAAYVWMTGYGNFIFFYKTNDYSFARLMKLLFRLNFFVAFVCITLNREFMQYYVCALHTFYFLCVYATMGIMYQWNKNEKLMGLKFVILFVILFLLFDAPSLGLFQTIFSPFPLFYWNNSLWEWWFRSKLDHYTTLFGMICAWKIRKLEGILYKIESLNQKQKWLAQGLLGGGITLCGLVWMVFCLWLPKSEYNMQHPYTSLIPIALYIVLRNLTPAFRKNVLTFFTYFGKITLETYILQFHIWLSDDAATIITYFPNYPMMNWILSTCIYIALSQAMFQITNILSDALIPRGCTTRDILFKMLVVLGGWYTMHNAIQFVMTR